MGNVTGPEFHTICRGKDVHGRVIDDRSPKRGRKIHGPTIARLFVVAGNKTGMTCEQMTPDTFEIRGLGGVYTLTIASS